MKRPCLFPATLTLVLLLVACSPKGLAQPAGVTPSNTGSTGQDLTRSDQQGAVSVEVTPLDLGQPGQTLDFQVSLNTHSVDLSMDLSKLATLSTDTGNMVQAIAWDGPGGGHHVTGKLSFPATENGKAILDGAAQLTLTIQNVDAASRTFTWKIAK